MDAVSVLKLVKNYNRDEHLRLLESNIDTVSSKLNSINSLFNPDWEQDNDSFPIIVKSHLLDSYYCLPERPDMAFTHIWKAINSAYNDYYLKMINGNLNYGSLSDSKSLDKVVEHISNGKSDSFEYESTWHSIDDIIEIFCNKIPLKTLRFVSGYLLKGLALEGESIPKVYISSSCKSFKSRFEGNYDVIKNTYGVEYKKLCTPIIERDMTDINYQVSDGDKSRRMVHSLAKSLKDALVNGGCHVRNSDNTYSGDIKFVDTKDKLEFLVFAVLYAIRNNNIHGNVVSRLNSELSNKESFKASEYVYLLAHMFLSLVMYKNGNLKISDLSVNMSNI